MVGLPDGEKSFEDMYNRLTEYRPVTDGRTDVQTSCHGIVRAMHTRRAEKQHRTARKAQDVAFACNERRQRIKDDITRLKHQQETQQ